MNSNNNSSSHGEVDQRNKESLDSRFNQTLKNVQGYLFLIIPISQYFSFSGFFLFSFMPLLRLLKGCSIPGKILLTRRSDILDDSGSQERSPSYQRSFSQNDAGTSDDMDKSVEEGVRNTNNSDGNTTDNKLTSSTSKNDDAANEVQNSAMGTRATDSARVTKFTKELSGQMVLLERLRELAWSGVPPYMRPNVWRLLLGYAPPNSDRREGVLRRKRLEYLDCVAQFYDIPDTERSADEINMLRQIAVDCPRTVPDVPFFQQAQVQKSLERILYTW
ncbi:hypothetical protein Golax_010357 [Gossypium laxum]|uniref:Rab-GAP TBC domain-containing protein n=1 Tax=Gossypium laxum TaxID=34288 RepID=A0A7J8ZH06_9ROSI|nr:hypothetical protein [Gossypium laxum]